MPSVSSWFGSSNTSTAAANANASGTTALPMNFECPSVTIRSGASTLTSSADRAEPAATNLRYQVGITTTARECRLNGSTLSIKVGMQGRVILGPEGSAGPIDVPIRYAVVREGVPPMTIATRLERVSVTVPPGDTNVLFSHVLDGLDFPMPPAGQIDSYVIYIGFDPIGFEEMNRKKPAPRPARNRKQA